MNDFTKEELIEIEEYCNWEWSNTAHSDFRRNLKKKIQSMIDNYCEHEFDFKDIGRVEICGKCEKIREFK